jgi:hypothetical protein
MISIDEIQKNELAGDPVQSSLDEDRLLHDRGFSHGQGRKEAMFRAFPLLNARESAWSQPRK